MPIERPLDALNEAKDKRVVVETKGPFSYIGTLRAFDIHLNLVLDNVDELLEGEPKRKLSRVLIRGDSITIVSPE